MGEDQKQNWFEKFTSLMDQNIRGVQYGVYSVAVIGLGVALRSVRPFKKFTQPQHIPKTFVEKHLTLNGKVVGIEPPLPSSPLLLLIDHSPIIPLQFLRPRSPALPVQISSVDVTTHGYSWLQHIIVGSHVSFTVLKLNPNSATCIVTKEKKNVALDLLALGFASVSPLDFSLEKDDLYLKYYKQLLGEESRAEKLGCGMWARDTKVSPASRILKKIPQGVNQGTTVAFKGIKNLISKLKFNETEHARATVKV